VTALRRLVHVLALALCLTACTGGEASDDGTAWITNKTGRDGLRI
jgi:hypothetical protein